MVKAKSRVVKEFQVGEGKIEGGEAEIEDGEGKIEGGEAEIEGDEAEIEGANGIRGWRRRNRGC